MAEVFPEVIHCIQCADNAIFMKAIAPVGAAVPGTALAVDFPVTLLCSNAVWCVDRVIVLQAVDNLVRVDIVRIVKSHAECFP